MYYHTENERYYKISNRKSVRVSKEEGENNITGVRFEIFKK